MKWTNLVWVVLLVALVGCKSTKPVGVNTDRMEKTRTVILSSVDDPARSEAMLVVVASLEKELKQIETKALAVRAEIAEANRNYDTTRSDLEKLYGQLGGLTQQLGDTAKEHSLALRKLCSESEWKQIASHKTEAVQFKF